ncbi:Cyclin-Dependent Kinase 9 [Manis pentadactyla]|nr:Cyclin-Dependent Kinase 9 [Manis pentadactyla]
MKDRRWEAFFLDAPHLGLQGDAPRDSTQAQKACQGPALASAHRPGTQMAHKPLPRSRGPAAAIQTENLTNAGSNWRPESRHCKGCVPPNNTLELPTPLPNVPPTVSSGWH